MGTQTVRRGSAEERKVVDDAVLAMIEKLLKDGEVVGATQLAYEMVAKVRRSEIDRSLQRLAIAEHIVFIPRLRGWIPKRFEKQALETVAKLDAKDQKKSWTKKKNERRVITDS